MPETTSQPGDPFADLYNRLPDPKARAASAASGADSPPNPATEAEDAASAPLSRRAAREAASTSTSVDGEPAPVPASAPSDVSATAAAPSASVAPTGSADSRDGAAQVAARPGATATLDDLFTGSVTTSEVGSVPRPDKRKRRIGGWIALAVVLAIFGGIAAGGFWVWNTYEEQIREFLGTGEPQDYEEGLATGEVLVTVAEGDNPPDISQTLYDAGVTKTPEAFYDMLIETQQSPTFYPGLYRLQEKMTSAAALAALENPANKLENTAQLVEGLTLEQSLVTLSESLDIPLEDFQAAVADPTAYGVPVDPEVAAAGGEQLEGWLFPATYTFDPGVTATDVIGRLVTQTTTVLGNLGVAEADRQRILTIASIVQREARYEEDMQKVSRVIQNRLDPAISDTNGLLQMDSTAQFGYGEMHDGTVSSSGEALRDPNPWNTYVNAGLPVGPISNPGEAAIFAAMNPPEGAWQYFVTVNLDTGETVFTNTIAEHEAAVAQWQQWCSDNPDSGC